METYLRCFVHACPTKWSQWLSLAEYWYNTSFHSSLGQSPFLVLYGYEPCHFGIDISQACQSSELSVWLQDRELLQQLVRHISFGLNPKLRPRLTSTELIEFSMLGIQYISKHNHMFKRPLLLANKLAFRFFGPFTFTERIGPSAYHLQLPPECHIHPVFHVSMLKKAVPANEQVHELPDFEHEL